MNNWPPLFRWVIDFEFRQQVQLYTFGDQGKGPGYQCLACNDRRQGSQYDAKNPEILGE